MPICASLAASISARTLSMTLRGMNAVASHWWLSVFMAVWIYAVRHLAMNGMSE